jgi:NADH:ubiquinone oxidoreductase subunit 6 (subunit J)
MPLPDTLPLIGITWADALFMLLGGVAVAGALGVVLGRDIIRNGLLLILTLGAIAGIYVMLGAAILAGAQVLVYIGAISVLILFAIMLTQSKAAPAKLNFQTQAVPAALISALLALSRSAAAAGTQPCLTARHPLRGHVAQPTHSSARTSSPLRSPACSCSRR